MKTISKRFLKASLAMLLVVVMLFGTTLTGFAASVDNADTKANVDVAETGATKTYYFGIATWCTFKSAVFKTATNTSKDYTSSKVDCKTTYSYNNNTFNVYSIDVDTQYTKVTIKIANNGKEYTKTDVALEDNKIILVRDFSGSATVEKGDYIILSGDFPYYIGESATDTTKRVYFVNTVGWDQVNCYAWNDSGNNEWPGVTMTKDTENTFCGYDIYYSDIDKNYTKVIFSNNGANKTGDLSLNFNYYYYGEGKHGDLVARPNYTITTAVSPTNGGTVTAPSNGATVTPGEKVSISATANSGYSFTSWTSSNGGTFDSQSSVTSFTPTADTTLTANFNPINYTINYHLGYDNLVDKSNTYTVAEDSVELSYTPIRENYEFEGWYADSYCSGSKVESFTPDTENPADVHFYAKWVPLYGVSVTVNPENCGTVSIDGHADNSVGVTKGTVLNFTADPEEGYHVTGWSVNDVLQPDTAKNTFTYTVGEEAAEIKVHFEKNVYTVNVSVNIPDAGTAEVSSTKVVDGNKVTLTANANEGYKFVRWELNGRDISHISPETFTVEGDTNGEEFQFEAIFTKVWNVTVIVPEDGVSNVNFDGGSTTETKTYEDYDGHKRVFWVDLESENYRLDGWTITKKAENGNETSENVTGDKIKVTIDAHTKVEPIVVPVYNATAVAKTNISGATGFTVTVDKAKAAENEKVTFTANVTDSNYEFIGWYTDDTFTNQESSKATFDYTVEDKDVTLYAFFAKKYYYVIQNDPNNRLKFEYNPASNEYTREYAMFDQTKTSENFGIQDEAGDLIKIAEVASANTTTVYINDGETYDGNLWRTHSFFYASTIEYDKTSMKAKIAFDETQNKYVLQIDATPLNMKQVNIVVDNGTKIEKHFSAGATARIEIPVPEGKYINDYTFDTAIVEGAQVENGNTIVFKMPEETDPPYKEITLNVNLGQMYKIYTDNSVTGVIEQSQYYIPGAEAVFEVKAQEKYDIESVVLKKADGTVIDSEDLEYTVTKNNTSCIVTVNSMPDFDIMVTAQAGASFRVKCDIECIDNFDTNGSNFCSVEVIADGKLLEGNSGYVSNDKRVSITAEATTAGDRGYTFLGYYDIDGNIVSNNKNYVVEKASDDIELKAVFYRNVYIIGTAIKGSETFVPMTFDYATKTYNYTVDIDNGTFDITTVRDVDDANFKHIMKNATSYPDGCTLTKTNTGTRTITGLTAKYTLPIKVTLTVNSSTSYSIDVKASPVEATLYLSSGREDYDPDFASGAFTVNSQFINYEGKYTVGAGGSAIRESYITASIPNEKMTVDVQTTITGSKAKYYDVAYYLVYDISDGSVKTIGAKDSTNGVFTAKIDVDGDSYIVPIYYANDNYIKMIESKGGIAKAVEITVNMNSIFSDESVYWGPFVSAYVWSGETKTSDDIDTIGKFPGQLMIHQGGGIYKTQVIVSTLEDFRGVTFSNYMTKNTTGANPDATVPGILYEEFKLYKLSSNGSTKNYFNIIQTYDYKEPVYLYQDDYDSITFKPMASDINSNFNYGVNRSYVQLTDYQGNPVDLYMNKIEGTNVNNTNKIHIVSENYFKCGTNGYTYDTSYQGEYSVKWHVYVNGIKKASILSGALFHKPVDENGVKADKTALIQELLLNADIEAEQLNGAEVWIDYDGIETGNNSTYNRVDGQWYGNRSTDAFTASIKVAFRDENGNIQVNSSTVNPNKAEYGEAYIDKNNDKRQSHSYTRKDDANTYGIVNAVVTATPLSTEDATYRFVGYKVGNDEYTAGPIPIDRDTEIIAIFEKVQDGTLFVTNEFYDNPYDPEIISHGGQGTRYVEIYECTKDGTIISDVLNSGKDLTRASAQTRVEEGKYYKVVLKVETQKPDYFYAWYMKDGDTFEEVLVTESDVKEKQYSVTAEFIYEYKKGSPLNIVIYSDIYEVSGRGKFVYTYKNRDLQDRTIVKEVKLTDDEINGCPENGNTPYRPIYMEYTPMSKEIEPGKFDIKKAYNDAQIANLAADGYEPGVKSSAVLDNAPSPNVTQAFLYVVSWKYDADHVKVDADEPTIIRITADNDPETFNVTAEVDGDTKVYQDKPYNTLIQDLEAPIKNKEGKQFSYWRDKKTNNIISYSRFYSYRIVDDREIEAVYEEAITAAWTPVIEEVDYTREYSQTGDFIYTDYLIAFHSRDRVELKQLQKELEADGNKDRVRYGLALVRDVKYRITDENNVTYPKYDAILDNVKTTVEANKSKGFSDGKGGGHNIYLFEFSDEETTNLNRIRHYIRYDNDNSNKYREYAFSAYAFLVIDDEIYISEESTGVNFFKLGNEDKDLHPAA